MVVDIAAELSVVDADAQTMILAYVNQALAVDEWGGEDSPTYKLARVYLAAHYGTVTLQGGNGPAGPAISQTVGGITRIYMNNSPVGSDPVMGKTPYGNSFLSLLRRSPAKLPVVI